MEIIIVIYPYNSCLQVFAIEFVAFAIEIIPFAIEFVGFTIEFVGFAVGTSRFCNRICHVCITIRHKQNSSKKSTVH